jgi:hypothetical protein
MMMTKLDWARFSALMLFAGVGGMDMAHADSLADPTRPAPEWLAAQPVAPGAEAASDGAASALQVIVIGPARRFAIIDGQMVQYGRTYNGAKLVGMRPDSVVLQKDGSKEKLSMSPAVEKKVRVSKPVASKFKSRKKVVNGEGK